MIYWVTGTITSSTRLYYESRNTRPSRPLGYIDVPTGAALFPKEITLPPRRWAETRYNIVHWTEMPRGGHFAALEQPDLLVEDMRTFLGRFDDRLLNGVGLSGYPDGFGAFCLRSRGAGATYGEISP